jgi:hypothetical protein
MRTQLLVLELNEELHAHLHRVSGVHVVLGDARSLPNWRTVRLPRRRPGGRDRFGWAADHAAALQRDILARRSNACVPTASSCSSLRSGGRRRCRWCALGLRCIAAIRLATAARDGVRVLRHAQPAIDLIAERSSAAASLALTAGAPILVRSNRSRFMTPHDTIRYARARRTLRGQANVRWRRRAPDTRHRRADLTPDLDPFLLLDEFGTDRPEDYIAGFPEHPHRGFETVTYMLDGRMRHRDNHGNEGLLTPAACNG